MRTAVITILLLLLCQYAYAANPVIFYSDLTSGPVTGGQGNEGAFVTIWGNNFGATRGSSYVTVGDGLVDNYPEWSNTKVCFQLGSLAATGDIVIKVGGVISNGIPFTVRNGNIFFITPAGAGTGTYANPCSPNYWYLHMAAGDIGYFRAGTYSGTYGDAAGFSNFCFRTIANGGQCNQGTEANPIACAAYPGEAAAFSAPGSGSPSYNFRVYPGGTYEAAWFTFSKFDCFAYDACFTAGSGWRIVGNDCEGLTRTTALQAGIIGTLGKSARIFGNDIHGGRTASHDGNAISAGGCLSDGGIDIGWNHIQDNNFDYGPLIFFNSEGTGACGAAEYVDDSSVHDNILDASSYPCCAVQLYDLSAFVIDPDIPTVSLYNNVIIDSGHSAQTLPSLYLANGKARVYNNTFVNSRTWAVSIYDHSPADPDLMMMDAEIYNNIMDMDAAATAYYDVNPTYSYAAVFSHNSYFGIGTYGLGDDADPVNGDPLFVDRITKDYSLTASSPCRDTGTDAVNFLVTQDINGLARPNHLLYDIGAYEYDATAAVNNSFSSGGGGGCFIATVVYGDTKEKQILERFRDTCLLKNRWGRAFVRFYYRFSPPLAGFIRKREGIRLILKEMLRPVVWLAEKAMEKQI